MIELILKYEGFREDAYQCSAGVWTIGYGTTFYPDNSQVKKGDKITKERALELVDWYCKNFIFFPKGEFSEDQKAALSSLIYNIGQRAFNRSKCRRAIEEKNWKEAYDNWNWIYADGKILNGLVKRREEEKKLFFRGLYEPK